MTTALATCPTCGSKRSSMSVTEWRTNTCNCSEQYTLAQHYTRADIPNNKPDEFWYQSLEGDWKRSKTNKEYKVASKYIATLPERIKQNTSLLFSGSPGQGTGKTFLAVCILKEVLKLGFSGKYIDFQLTTPQTLLSLDNYQFLIIDNVDQYSSAGNQPLINSLYRLLRYRKHPVVLITSSDLSENKPLQSVITHNSRKLVEVPFALSDNEKTFVATRTIFPEFDDLFGEPTEQSVIRSRLIR